MPDIVKEKKAGPEQTAKVAVENVKEKAEHAFEGYHGMHKNSDGARPEPPKDENGNPIAPPQGRPKPENNDAK